MTDYVINTFVTQRESNMDIAIKYYRQKTDFLLQSLETKMHLMTNKALNNIEDFNAVFENKLNEVSAQMEDLETFYNKKIKGMELQNRIAEYNKTVQSISNGIEQGFQTIQFLQYLQGNTDSVGALSGMPATIDLSAQSKVLETMAQRGYDTASAAGGARARLMGEITEQVIVEMVKGNLNDLFKHISQAGTLQTRNFAGLTQGKSDMLFAAVDMDFKNLDTKETVAVIKDQEIELDLVEAVDLEGSNVEQTLARYLSGARGLVGGMTIKQWSDKVLGTHNATFAHSSYTMNLINSRYPNKMIAEKFSNRQTFRQYTAYVISKFLINVIGAYNILVGNASGIETTANWLEKLKTEGYMLEHVIGMENSIWTAKDTIYVGRAV